MKKIFLIFAHPREDSLCGALRHSYLNGADAACADLRELNISKLVFNPHLENAYREIQPLEADLVEAQSNIEWCEHLVFIFPIWWGGMPARLKGFIDRTFLPGWGFKFERGAKFQKKLLSGRSARIIVTMDNYPFLYRFRYGMPGIRQLKGMVLEFCGISPVRTDMFGSAKFASAEKIQRWLKKVEQRGSNDAVGKI